MCKVHEQQQWWKGQQLHLSLASPTWKNHMTRMFGHLPQVALDSIWKFCKMRTTCKISKNCNPCVGPHRTLDMSWRMLWHFQLYTQLWIVELDQELTHPTSKCQFLRLSFQVLKSKLNCKSYKRPKWKITFLFKQIKENIFLTITYITCNLVIFVGVGGGVATSTLSWVLVKYYVTCGTCAKRNEWID